MASNEMAPLEVVSRLYDCFESADLEGALALISTDIVITQDPALPWGGRYVGPEGAIEFFASLVGTIDSAVTKLALFEAGDTVVQYGTTAGTVVATGAEFSIPECHIWRVCDGSIVSGQMFIDSAAMLAALGVATNR